jgi:brefeldin A-inhibited guanine nucleotide-exchange protein
MASAPAGLVPGKSGEQQNQPPTPATNKNSHGNAAPSFNTTYLTVAGSMDTSNIGLSERHLKRQGLEALVAILKSLVTWGTASTKPAPAPETATEPSVRSRTSEDTRAETLTPDPSTDRLSWLAHHDMARQSSPTVELADDPMKFENAKQKKTTLLEGIRKFNAKPKRVRSWINRDLLRFLRKASYLGHRILPRDGLHQEQGASGDCCLPSADGRLEQGHGGRIPWRRVLF